MLSFLISCDQEKAVEQKGEEVKIKVFQIYPSYLTLTVGQLFPLSIIAEDERGQKVGIIPVWESSNTSVVFVSSSGVVKALSPGSATITATYLDLTTSAVVKVLTPQEYAEYLTRVYQEYGTATTGVGISQPGFGGGVTIINQYVTYLTYSPGATDMLCDLNVCLVDYISRHFGRDVRAQDSVIYGNYLILRSADSCHFINLTNPDSPEYAGSSTTCNLRSIVKGDKVINADVSYQEISTTASKPYFVYDIYSFSQKDGNLTLNYQGRVSSSGEAVYSQNFRILSTELLGDYLYSITSVEFFYRTTDYPWILTYYITHYLNVFDLKNMSHVKTMKLSGLETDIEFFSIRYDFSYAITVHTSPYIEPAKLINVGDKLYLLGAFRCGDESFIPCRIPQLQLKGVPVVYSVFDISNPADPQVLSSGITEITVKSFEEFLRRIIEEFGVDVNYEVISSEITFVFSPVVKVGNVIYAVVRGELVVNFEVDRRIYPSHRGFSPSLLFNFYHDPSGVKHDTIFEAGGWDIIEQKPFHISGNRFYLNTSTSIVVFDVSSPRTPNLVDYIFPIQSGSIWVDGGRIYVYSWPLGLQVLDLTGDLRGLFRIVGVNGIVFAKDRNVYLLGENFFITLKYMRPE